MSSYQKLSMKGSLFFRDLSIEAYMIVVCRCHWCIGFYDNFLIVGTLDFGVLLISFVTILSRAIYLFKVSFTQHRVLFFDLSVSFYFVIIVLHYLFLDLIDKVSHLIQEKSSVYAVLSHRLRDKTEIIWYSKV